MLSPAHLFLFFRHAPFIPADLVSDYAAKLLSKVGYPVHDFVAKIRYDFVFNPDQDNFFLDFEAKLLQRSIIHFGYKDLVRDMPPSLLEAAHSKEVCRRHQVVPADVESAPS